MGDPKDIGFWIAVFGGLGALLWNLANFVRHPTFVSRSRIDDLAAALAESRTVIAELRVEIVDWKRKHAAFEAQVRSLMADSEWWRNQYRELREKSN